MNQSDYRPVDKIVGIILIFFSMCGVACGGLIAAFGSFAGVLAATAASDPANRDAAGPIGLVAGGALVIGIAIAACYLLSVAGAVGVMKSRRWGFTLTAILSGLATLFSLSGSTGFLDTLPNLAACVYCILRLNGTLPPKPD